MKGFTSASFQNSHTLSLPSTTNIINIMFIKHNLQAEAREELNLFIERLEIKTRFSATKYRRCINCGKLASIGMLTTNKLSVYEHSMGDEGENH